MEIWKKVADNESYAISSIGRIKSLSRTVVHNISKSTYMSKEKILKPSNSNTKKYWRIGLNYPDKRYNKAIHRLVAEAFIPNPDNLSQVNHIDGDRNNNNVENLEWCTNLYNMRHANSLGLRADMYRKLSGEGSNLNKYSEETIKKIPLLVEKGLSYAEVAHTLGISKTLITEIKAGRTWKHLNIIIPDSKYCKKKI